jgi:ectoine hydroxylase-related dioxygenase (phytanoyl-CoA dioxygenase family)
MNKDGFEIIRQVIPSAEAERCAKRALSEMETRDNMSHSDTIWSLRTHPSVLAVFRRLWNTEDIVTGFDGIGVSHGGFVLPWHVDQQRHSTTCIGIQGIMALSRHDAMTGGLSLISGTHKQHSSIVVADDTQEWEYQEVDVTRYMGSMEVMTPILAPGDMCVWDSRTCHCVRAGSGSSRRITAYLSFEPRSHVTSDVARRRRRAVTEGIATTHWASRFVDREDARCPPTTISADMRRIV